jgi:hypothetical protein
LPTPGPADEGRHEPGPEELWNESWYFDVVSDDGTIGVYHRIGRMPNRGICMLGACIVRVDGPAIMLSDGAAPLPAADDDSQLVETGSARAEFTCEEPLERFSIAVSGTAESFADQSAPLRKDPGEPVDIAIAMTWETVGVPYQWGHSTRYEIPCRVTGTVTIDGERIEVAGPGQRDHSWGTRDWFASDWMWSALHLDDGTHTHAVSVPQHPNFGVGYVQKDGELIESPKVKHENELATNGLVTGGILRQDPGGVDLRYECLASGPVLLESPDGRVSHFPRAMVRTEDDKGRTGLGWIEWNMNQPAPGA